MMALNVSKGQIYFLWLSAIGLMALTLGVWNGSMEASHQFRSPRPLGPKPNHAYQNQLKSSKQPIASARRKISTTPTKTPSSFAENLMEPKREVPITRKPSKIQKTKKKPPKVPFKMPPPMSRSLFSFMSMRPGSKKNPIDFGVKLLVKQLDDEVTKHKDIFATRRPSKAVLESHEGDYSNWDLPGDYKISDPIPANRTTNILIATSWRSGSTFLGDILKHYPSTFYSFEPLHFLSNSKMSQEDLKTFTGAEAVELLRDIFKCDFKTPMTTSYLSHCSMSANQFLIKHNTRMWNACSPLLPASSACFMPNFVSQACPIFPVRLIKTVRLRVSGTEPLLRDKDLNLKMIILVRDPRGVMNSRSKMDWCDKPKCADVGRVCSDLEKDFEAAKSLKVKYPNQVELIRFEDLSMYPYTTVENLINFLGLSWQRTIERFLRSHTQMTREDEGKPLHIHLKKKKVNPYGTIRNSRETTFKWADTMIKSKIANIEQECQKPMANLGYKLFDKVDNGNYVSKQLSDIWP